MITPFTHPFTHHLELEGEDAPGLITKEGFWTLLESIFDTKLSKAKRNCYLRNRAWLKAILDRDQSPPAGYVGSQASWKHEIGFTNPVSSNWVCQGGLVYKKSNPKAPEIPTEELYQFLTRIHVEHGHHGRDKLYNLVAQQAGTITKDLCGAFSTVCCPEARAWQEGGSVAAGYLPPVKKRAAKAPADNGVNIDAGADNGDEADAHAGIASQAAFTPPTAHPAPTSSASSHLRSSPVDSSSMDPSPLAFSTPASSNSGDWIRAPVVNAAGFDQNYEYAAGPYPPAPAFHPQEVFPYHEDYLPATLAPEYTGFQGGSYHATPRSHVSQHDGNMMGSSQTSGGDFQFSGDSIDLNLLSLSAGQFGNMVGEAYSDEPALPLPAFQNDESLMGLLLLDWPADQQGDVNATDAVQNSIADDYGQQTNGQAEAESFWDEFIMPMDFGAA